MEYNLSLDNIKLVLHFSTQFSNSLIIKNSVTQDIPLGNIIDIKCEYFKIHQNRLVPITGFWSGVECDKIKVTLEIYDDIKKSLYDEVISSNDSPTIPVKVQAIHTHLFANELRFLTEKERRNIIGAINNGAAFIPPNEMNKLNKYESIMKLWKTLYSDGVGTA